MQRILEQCTGRGGGQKKEIFVTVCSNPTCMQTTPTANTMAFHYRQRIQKEDNFRPFSLTAGPKQVSSLYPRGVTESQSAFLPSLSRSRGNADWTTGGRSNEEQSDEAGSQLHLFSMSVCTLCTSSRAILKMCWTSCRSAISITHNIRHMVTICHIT